MFLLRLFRAAGATGHVFFLKNGRTVDRGLAFSGLIGPKTTVAVVPTTPQIVNFAIEAQTVDNQRVTVYGSLTVTFNPSVAVSKFDFTVDTKQGGYLGNWEKVLAAKVTERVLREVLNKLAKLDVEGAIRAQQDVESAVTLALGATIFAADGITVSSCSIPKIEPTDDEVAESIGVSERQLMLTNADAALHTRRMKAVENDRAVKQFEVDTKIELEKKQGALLEEQAKNKLAEATTDAAATKTRLAPLENIEGGKLLGIAVMEAARGGRLGNLAITTELLAAVSQK
jgi:hypothetical protein